MSTPGRPPPDPRSGRQARLLVFLRGATVIAVVGSAIAVIVPGRVGQAAGAAVVFFTKRFNQAAMDGVLGLAAGVMIAASFWSLLAPAIEMSGGDWLPATVGFMAGGLFLYVADKLLPHLHPGLAMSEAEGIHTSWRRSVLLVSAITLHNIPEGLAVGVAFTSLNRSKRPTTQ